MYYNDPMFVLLDSILKPIHLFLISNKRFILSVTTILYILLAITIFAGLPLYLLFPKLFGLFLSIGKKAGTLSLILYAASLTPGILKRIQKFPIIQVMFMLFRREFGILMFLTMIIHSTYTQIYPYISLGQSLLLGLSPRIIFGIIAEIILVPLWITSNDWSVKTLKKGWNAIHKLTHVALLFIVGHILLINGEIATKLFTAGVLMLEVYSWIVLYKRNTEVK